MVSCLDRTSSFLVAFRRGSFPAVFVRGRTTNARLGNVLVLPLATPDRSRTPGSPQCAPARDVKRRTDDARGSAGLASFPAPFASPPSLRNLPPHGVVDVSGPVGRISVWLLLSAEFARVGGNNGTSRLMRCTPGSPIHYHTVSFYSIVSVRVFVIVSIPRQRLATTVLEGNKHQTKQKEENKAKQSKTKQKKTEQSCVCCCHKRLCCAGWRRFSPPQPLRLRRREARHRRRRRRRPPERQEQQQRQRQRQQL